MGIGIILKELIEEKSTNVNELAAQIAISPQTLYSIIKRDNMKVDLDVLFKICDELEIDVNVFYSDFKNKQYQTNQSSSQVTENLLAKLNELNDEGKERVAVFIDDLISSHRYENLKATQVESMDEPRSNPEPTEVPNKKRHWAEEMDVEAETERYRQRLIEMKKKKSSALKSLEKNA